MRERATHDVEGELRNAEDRKKNALAAVEKIAKEDAVHNAPTELDVPIALEKKKPHKKKVVEKVVTIEEVEDQIAANEVPLDPSEPLPSDPERIPDIAETKAVEAWSELSNEKKLRGERVASELFAGVETVDDSAARLEGEEFGQPQGVSVEENPQVPAPFAELAADLNVAPPVESEEEVEPNDIIDVRSAKPGLLRRGLQWVNAWFRR